jgi:hypothetical protein
MRATAIEFRLRMAINAVIIILGFWAPWIEWFGLGRRISLTEWLALEISRAGTAPFGVATAAVVVIALIFAVAAVVCRVWGTAYLGPSTVSSFHMIAGKVMADGPYRFLRNPLYIGVWCMVVAMAFLMPASGALWAVVLITIFMVRLTLGEEVFLAAQLGEPYRVYLNSVPRFIPRLRGAPEPAGAKPHWIRAVMAELTPIGISVAIVVFARNYDLRFAGRVILVFFGASLVVRAFVPKAEANVDSAN